MRIEQLKYLIAIQEYGSLSKAAENLYITHSALSIAVSKLENELNAKIFERTNKGLMITEYGEKVIESAKKIIAEVDYIKAESPQKANVLHIASIATISNNILLDVIVDFKKERPQYNIVTEEISPSDALKKVTDMKAKIGISFYEKNKEESFLKMIEEHSLYWKPLYCDYLCVYVAKDNPLLHKKEVYEKDLRDYVPVSINHRQKSESKRYYNNFIDNEFMFSFTNQESIKKFIVERNAIAYLPKILSYNDFYVKSGNIVPLDIIDNRQEIIHYAVFSEKLSHDEQYFLEKVKTAYDNLKKD